IQTRQVEIEPTDANSDIHKPCVCCKVLQFIFVRDLPRGTKFHGGRVAKAMRERFADCAVVWTDSDPDAERQTSATDEHAAHLPKRQRLVGKELKSLLTENRIEAGTRQSQVERTALEPLDGRARLGRERPRYSDHSRIEVNP